MKPGYTGIKRLACAAKFSLQGLVACWRHESAFREEVLLALIAVPLGIHLGASGVERALLVASVVLVPVVELLNTGVETVVDRIGDGEHALSRRAKDVGSAAVMLSLILAALVWILVLGA